MHYKIKVMSDDYKAILNGEKTFDIRNDHQNYHIGDTLEMCEYDGKYTGRSTIVEVKSITQGNFLKDGYSILSFQVREKKTKAMLG